MSIMPSPRRNIRTLVFLMPDSVKYMEQVLELARCTNGSTLQTNGALLATLFEFWKKRIK